MPRQRGSETVRLFIAIYPPLEVARQFLADLALLDLPPHRPTPVEQVHLTVHFVGPVPQRRAHQIAETMRRAARGIASFDLTPQRFLSLPQSGPPPRLVAVETDAPASLLELHRRLVQRLARSPRHKPSDRFTPHFTLCRFERGRSASGDARPQAIDIAIDTPPFRVEAALLMKSDLHPDGARHTEVARATLADGG
jgi:RNA 2',3'-cyclic 3'-phosphodiesterase